MHYLNLRLRMFGCINIFELLYYSKFINKTISQKINDLIDKSDQIF